MAKSWNFPNLQMNPESSQNELCRCSRVQNGSPGSKEPTNYVSRPIPAIFPAKSADICKCNIWPIRPAIRPESAGKYIFWILWIQETHFAPSNVSITHFATILSSIKDQSKFWFSWNSDQIPKNLHTQINCKNFFQEKLWKLPYQQNKVNKSVEGCFCV